MVLQLVMFFMVCANFVMEQVNDTIKLPTVIAPLCTRRAPRKSTIAPPDAATRPVNIACTFFSTTVLWDSTVAPSASRA